MCGARDFKQEENHEKVAEISENGPRKAPGLEKCKKPLYSLPNDDPENDLKSPEITKNHLKSRKCCKNQ